VPIACPACGSVQIELLGGEELMLESIEYRN
jgi:Zn finger protein HypA/HybF involved in hydrogenase expression